MAVFFCTDNYYTSLRLRSISEAVSDRERKMRTVIVAYVVALVAVVSAQTPPDCAELDVGASELFTGISIPIIIGVQKYL